MKNIIVVLLCIFISKITTAQAGKYSGKYKQLLGKVFEYDKLDNTLKGFTYWQYSETDATNGYTQMVTIYKKETTYLLILHTKEAESNCAIQDVVELNNIAKNTNFQMGSCKKNNNVDPTIIAIEKKGKYLLAFKVHKDKNRFDKISPKGIDCMVEGI
jgi:hypothetical protein